MSFSRSTQNDEIFSNIWSVWSSDSVAEFPEYAPERAKRVRRENSMLANYAIDCPLPSATQTVSASLKGNLRRAFVSIFDQVIQELDSPFNERSMEFVHCLLALKPKR